MGEAENITKDNENGNLSTVSVPDTSQEEVKRMLEEIKKTNDRQLKYAKKQYHMSFISTVACCLMLAAVCVAIVMVIPYIGVVYGDLNAIMGDLKVVTGELAELDIEDMYSGVQDLIMQGSEGLEEAFSKIDEIDIEGLNRAIKNLSDAVQPFAAFFGRGR